jgi:hypothetical protein
MIEALIAGERDSARPAELAKGTMRPTLSAVAKRLTSHLGATTPWRRHVPASDP